MIQRVNMREYSMYLDPVQTLFLVVAFLYDTTVHGEVNIMGLQYAPNIPSQFKITLDSEIRLVSKLAKEYHNSVSKNQKWLPKICFKSALVSCL